MSLILDALRKSEAERRRGETPSLYSSQPVPGTRQRPAWLRAAPWLFVALLLVAVVLAFALRDDAPATKAELVRSTPDGSVEVEVEAEPDATATPAPVAPPALATPVAPPSAPAAPPPTVDALVKAPGPAVVAPAPPPAAATPTPVEVAPTPPTEEALPPLAVLEPSTRTSLPPLKLSMHVYNSEPARRFAIIDGQRVTEGAELGAAVVTEIRRDGVVLDVNGRRVLVPRP